MKLVKSKSSLLALGLLSYVPLAFAVSIEGKLSHVSMERQGRDLAPLSEIQTTLTAPLFEVSKRVVVVQVEVPYAVCDQNPHFSTGDWKGFFEAQHSEKPARLAHAIKGLSTQTATYMVINGYFTHRPNSWEAFADEINRADAQFENGLAYLVTVKNGKRNMQKLGYFSQTECKIQTRMESRTQVVEDKHPFKNVVRNFKVLLTGGLLLKGEREQFDFSFDGFTDKLVIKSEFNTYTTKNRSENGDTVVYEVTGKRNLTPPVNTLSVIPSNHDGLMTLSVVDSAFDAEMGSTQGQAIIEATLYQYVRFWFDKKIGTIEMKLSGTDSETLLQTGVRFPQNSQGYATYTLKRLGSNFHTDEKSKEEKTSSKVTF